MRCFIDSNILFSAGIFPNSVPATALIKAFTPPNEVIVSDYSLDEVRRAVAKKRLRRIKTTGFSQLHILYHNFITDIFS